MSKYFKLSEFSCNCGCGKNNISSMLVKMLDAVREELDTPITITSGSRCEAWNSVVGGVPSSSHLAGLAADIACKNSIDRFGLINALVGAGFRRIGVAKTFVHVDIDGDKQQDLMYLY